MLINERTLEEFHDSVLISIQVDWEKEMIVIDFDLSSYVKESKIIYCRNFSMFKCPHENPWGFSYYVNYLKTGELNNSDKKVLQIEMQSGDILEIECETLELI